MTRRETAVQMCRKKGEFGADVLLSIGAITSVIMINHDYNRETGSRK